jgi:YD repeat-containing protein
MRRVVVVAFALAILVCALKIGALAQSDPCNTIVYVTSNTNQLEKVVWSPWPPPLNPPCIPLPGILLQCAVRTFRCAPPNAPQETCPGCNKPTAGQPINLATGNTYIIESDLSIPGLGGGLRLSRTWNSMLPSIQSSYAFMFGPNWRSTYEERLILDSCDGYLKYAREDGSVWSFGLLTVTPKVYQTAAPANDTTTITANLDASNATASFTLVSKSGEKRIFDGASGVLLSIVDRNGNTTQLTYDASSRLTTVTDPASRHLTFTYTSSSSNLVSTVTSDAGITLSYAYDGQGRLTQVTKPDNTTVSFVYDAKNMITAVKDSEGKILESHTYDVLGRGLTSSRANGVDSVTVSYPQ